MKTYHIPERPYTPIDALNRRAAALGSPGLAQSTEDADYNGHHVSVSWNDCRGYYITQYWWAGRRVLARGSFAQCLQAAVDEYKRGALGSFVTITPREDDSEAITLCENHELLKPGRDQDRSWYTWRHKNAAGSARDYANPGMMRNIFDWKLMQAAETEKEYHEALKKKYGRTHEF